MDQRGFTLIELLVAMFVLSVGITATVAVFSSSKKTSLIAQRHEVAVHQAQRALEELGSIPYSQLGLTKKPAISNRLESSPTTIGYHIDANTTDASSFTVISAGTGPARTEHLVLPDSAPSGTVNPDPTTFNVGGSGISGKVYRYVTWRNENCGTDSTGQDLCPGDRNTKRILVAVTIDSMGRPGLTRPVWVSSVEIDPTSSPYQ